MHDNDLNNDTEKFLFHLNDFGGEALLEAEAAAAEPPPASYDDQELEAAKKAAFEEGRKQGMQDSDASKLKFVQSAIQNLVKKTGILANNEAQRDQLFENEAVHLCFSIFESIFPLYFAKNGLEELKEAILSTLEAQKEQSPINVYCHADELEDLQTHFKDNGLGEHITLHARDDIAAGDCEISWKDGGAAHNVGAVSQNIAQLLEKTLDHAGVKRDEIPVEDGTIEQNCAIIDEQEPDTINEQASNDGENA